MIKQKKKKETTKGIMVIKERKEEKKKKRERQGPLHLTAHVPTSPPPPPPLPGPLLLFPRFPLRGLTGRILIFIGHRGAWRPTDVCRCEKIDHRLTAPLIGE